MTESVRSFYLGEEVLYKRHGKTTTHRVRKVLHDKSGTLYLLRPPIQPGLSRMWVHHSKLSPREGADMRDSKEVLDSLNPANWKPPELA